MKTQRGLLRAIPILITVLAVAGCSGGQTTPATPSPSPSVGAQTPVATPASTPALAPSLTPSRTSPPDVAGLFAATVLDPQYEGAGPISGAVTIGNLEGTLSGAMAVSGADNGFMLTMDFPGVLQSSTGTLRVDGHLYETRDGGPWFEVTTSAATSDAGSLISRVAGSVTDLGVVTKAGQELHHLVPANADAMTAADFGMTDPSMADSTATIEFYARDDGSLAVLSMGIAWTADLGGQPVPASIAMDVTFAKGDKAAISPPDEVWAWFTSEQHGYTIGYPTGMYLKASTSESGADAFAYSPTQFAGAIREHQPTAAADNLGAYVRAFKRATDWKLATDEATEVAGRPAWRLAYSHKLNGEKQYWVYTLLIQGRNGYMIFATGPVEYQEDVLAFHERQLSTLHLPGD